MVSMLSNRFPPLPTTELVQRLIAAERNCYVAWLRAMEALPGNPLGITIRAFGRSTALVCAKIPAEIFNRVFEMTVDDREHIPAILALYREHGATPLFDLSPYAIPPFWVQPNVPPLLAQHGLYHGAFHQILYGVPTTDVPPTPPHITIKHVTHEDADEFGRTYEQVWGDGIAIRVLIGQPQFGCYLAYVDGEAAALAVLHVANGVGSMANALTIPAFRGQGCQTALLHRRIADATAMGCDLLVSQCSPGSESQRNQLRTGFHIAGSKAWWVPMAAQA
jgi:GNAT superfamily N-acetyltransferase